jgi:hypothetical protein
MFNKINAMDIKAQKIEVAARQAAQRQAAKIAAKRAYDIAIHQQHIITQTEIEAAAIHSASGDIFFLYLVVPGMIISGDDVSNSRNFVNLDDAQEYAQSLTCDYKKIYLHKTDGTFMLLDL